jgi:hypothetical protein
VREVMRYKASNWALSGLWPEAIWPEEKDCPGECVIVSMVLASDYDALEAEHRIYVEGLMAGADSVRRERDALSARLAEVGWQPIPSGVLMPDGSVKPTPSYWGIPQNRWTKEQQEECARDQAMNTQRS